MCVNLRFIIHYDTPPFIQNVFFNKLESYYN